MKEEPVRITITGNGNAAHRLLVQKICNIIYNSNLVHQGLIRIEEVFIVQAQTFNTKDISK